MVKIWKNGGIVEIDTTINVWYLQYLKDMSEKSISIQNKPTITFPGAFKKDNEIYIIKYNMDKTYLYSLKLKEAPSDRLNAKGEKVAFEFEYFPQAMKFLTNEDRMSLEEGKRLTILYGRCIICGHRLKVAQSLEKGMGPVCANYFKYEKVGLTKKEYLSELHEKNAIRMKIGGA
jgi:hypothetical protein